jgi:GcrA cell cycle regulator
MTWTEQKIQMLKDMWGHGYSASEIAKILGGLTRNAVIGKAHRLKLSTRPATGKVDTAAIMRVSSSSPSVMPITKVAQRRVMLRPLPVVPTPAQTVKPVASKEQFRSFDTIKRTEGIAVTKAGDRHCRWPVGDPRSPDFRFCGCNAHEGLPYCVDHARVAYQNVGKKFRNSDGEGSSEFRLPGQGRY